MHAGSGLGSGKVSVTNLSYLEHYIDRASPNLFKYRSSGKQYPQAILVMRKAGGNPLEHPQVHFHRSDYCNGIAQRKPWRGNCVQNQLNSPSAP